MLKTNGSDISVPRWLQVYGLTNITNHLWSLEVQRLRLSVSCHFRQWLDVGLQLGKDDFVR
jgi:hypothetical protein